MECYNEAFREPTEQNTFFTPVAWHLYNLLSAARKKDFWQWFYEQNRWYKRREMCIIPDHLEKFELGFNTFRVMDEPVLNEHRRLACKIVQDVCNSYRVTYNTNGTVWVSNSNDLEWWSVGGELVYRGKTIPYHVNIEMLETVYRLRITDPYADRMLDGDERKGIPEPQACREFCKNRNAELTDLMKKLDSSS